MGVIRYISDLHFDHTNILHFDNRPFLSVEQVFDKLEKEFLCHIADYTGKHYETFYGIKEHFAND